MRDQRGGAGLAEIDGTLAAHYQYWVLDDTRTIAASGQVVYDQFVSGQGYVLQSQTRVKRKTKDQGRTCCHLRPSSFVAKGIILTRSTGIS